MKWNTTGCGERLRAARKHTGTASTKASSVPQIAICTVSMAGVTSLDANSQLGGNMRERKSPIQGAPLTSSLKLTWLPMAAHQMTASRARPVTAYFHQPSLPPLLATSRL